MHDGCDKEGGKKDGTVAALPVILEKLINDGYKFAAVSELLGINPVISDSKLRKDCINNSSKCHSERSEESRL
ncbi:MAG: hypothetical protein A2Z50_01505 [Nitrospirae bacterium RBG_19FT_COMBO_42_15]|nr:MAG: hypothetical protein A2Z50_01505 [Nitrospirae bacterium RBG_19FT_COMBO_42_15]